MTARRSGRAVDGQRSGGAAKDANAVQRADRVEPDSLFRLDGKVCIVTGASGGIGLNMARALCAAGATVLLAARRIERLESAAGELERAHPIRCDITREEDLQRLISAASQLGGLDVLVNNAGVVGTADAINQSPAEFRAALEVNLVAPFRLAQLAAIEMRRAGTGSIINIISILGLVSSGPLHTEPSYAAGKGGLAMLTRELAVQWARYGIRVNGIAPGWFRTEMTEDVFADDRGAGWIERNTPLRRGGQVDELTGALLLLASPAGSYMTGQIVTVDGGWTAV